MFPIILDLARTPVALVGAGPQTARRLALLDEDHAAQVTVYAAEPEAALMRAAGARLRRRWPSAEEIGAHRILFIGDGVEPGLIETLVEAARTAGTLVNVEDQPGLCDFHSPAMVRRGDLLLTVSTGGKSPALAHRLGRFLGGVFGPEWRERLEDLATLRGAWRQAGADPAMVGAWTDAWVDRHGDLPAEAGAAAALRDETLPPLAAQ